MADGAPLIIGAQNAGVQPTVLRGDDGEFAIGMEVSTPGDATVANSAAIIGRSPDLRKGLLGIGHPGVHGTSSTPDGVGVAGRSDDGYGISGVAGNVGMYARNAEQGHEAYLGSRCCAADFYGDVYVHGQVTKSGGGFLIDHPQDAANMYLSHSFVESSERKNIYEGIAIADSEGEAVIELPGWFAALNTDIRYQLTPIGAPAPDLHIAEEAVLNQFKIAGGLPDLKISWLVTGVRQDAWARAHPLTPEYNKPDDERGSYQHPELLGEAMEHGLAARRYPDGAHRA